MLVISKLKVGKIIVKTIESVNFYVTESIYSYGRRLCICHKYSWIMNSLIKSLFCMMANNAIGV